MFSLCGGMGGRSDYIYLSNEFFISLPIINDDLVVDPVSMLRELVEGRGGGGRGGSEKQKKIEGGEKWGGGEGGRPPLLD